MSINYHVILLVVFTSAYFSDSVQQFKHGPTILSKVINTQLHKGRHIPLLSHESANELVDCLLVLIESVCGGMLSTFLC